MDRSRLLAALRVAVVGSGLLGYVAVTAFVLSLPPPPETGDGVPAGFAFAFALLGTAVAGVVTVVGYGLPAGAGRLSVGPLAAQSSACRLLVSGGVAVALGLGCALGLSFVTSGMVAVAVWVDGVGLILGGVVALVLGGLAAGVRRITGGRGGGDEDDLRARG